MNRVQANGRATAFTNARIFDGEQVTEARTVVVQGPLIRAVGGGLPADATIIDARGATLMPGLIDAHVHTDTDGLRDALLFGVTTELEMMGHWTAREREEVADRDDIADLRSPGMGMTPPGGHPTEYMALSDVPGMREFTFPFVSTPNEAVEFVAARVAEGADYIKIFLEDGTVLGIPGLPLLSNATFLAAVREAHRFGKMAIVHSTTAATTKQALEGGADGLAHLFMDRPMNAGLVDLFVASGSFVTPCLTVTSTAMGHTAAELAGDERVSSRLGKKWLDSLRASMNVYPQGDLDEVLRSVLALHRAGVDILAGTDVSEPLPNLAGLAHGASLHHELQLLVRAGLSPIEALRSATSVPARRFGLVDRGRIMPGARADLVLVEGNPTTSISATLSTLGVWRRGVRLPAAGNL